MQPLIYCQDNSLICFFVIVSQAIRGNPTSWSYWSDLGWCYHAEGKQAAALKAYTRAEELLEDSLLEPTPLTEGEGKKEEGCSPEEDETCRVELVARVRVRTQVGEGCSP